MPELSLAVRGRIKNYVVVSDRNSHHHAANSHHHNRPTTRSSMQDNDQYVWRNSTHRSCAQRCLHNSAGSVFLQSLDRTWGGISSDVPMAAMDAGGADSVGSTIISSTPWSLLNAAQRLVCSDDDSLEKTTTTTTSGEVSLGSNCKKSGPCNDMTHIFVNTSLIRTLHLVLRFSSSFFSIRNQRRNPTTPGDEQHHGGWWRRRSRSRVTCTGPPCL